MENVLSEGQGFVFFAGHGSPMVWGNHPHGNFSTWIHLKLRNIMKLTNGEKLPVVLVSGCHNNQFDVSILHLIKIWEGKELYDYIYWREISPVCWGWLFTRHENGGAIATLGATGFDYGGSAGDGPYDEVPDSVPDGIPDVVQYLGGWLNPHFFEVYANGTTILGQTFVTSIIDYLNQFPIDWNHEFQEERPYTIDRVNCKKIRYGHSLAIPHSKLEDILETFISLENIIKSTPMGEVFSGIGLAFTSYLKLVNSNK